jgi:predicted AAA+ superfamily ATPase
MGQPPKPGAHTKWQPRLPLLPRLAERHLAAVLKAQPVAAVMGARQAGKSTLVRNTPALRDHLYLTLDSVEIRAQALDDPEALAGRAPRLILDEVQRAPDLVIAIKAAVDAEPRRPGRFVLTGSANLLAVKRVKETLAGRASYVTLWPLTRRERLGLGAAGCWSELADTPVSDWPDVLAAQTVPPAEWRDLAQRSGYPPVVSGGLDPAEQADWLQGYLDAYVERDVAELSQISRPLDLLRLMRAAAAHIGQVEHQVTWARTTGLATSTLSRWTDLLETTYQLVRIPAFSVNRTKRLTKSPKVFWSDTAMALHLAGLAEPTGHHLENLVVTDLQAWASSRSPRPAVMHWRTTGQIEVDLVIELPSGRLLPVEIKAAGKPGWSDILGLRAFLEEYDDLALGGLVIHGGTTTYRLSPKIVATPWWRVI